MARRRSRGMLGGLLSGRMMWYALYAVGGYFAYTYITQMQQVQNLQQDTRVPPVALLP
jgi:hypothetical protein